MNCTRSCTALRHSLKAAAGLLSLWWVLLRRPGRRGAGCWRSEQKQSSIKMEMFWGFCMWRSSAIWSARVIVRFIQNFEMVTIVESPMGPESSCVWCLPANVKLVDDRHSLSSSMMSSTVSLVWVGRSVSFSMVFLSSLRQSVMGILGKSAVAS